MKFLVSSQPESGQGTSRVALSTTGVQPVWVARQHDIVDMLRDLDTKIVPISAKLDLPAGSSSAATEPLVMYAKGSLCIEAWRDDQAPSTDAPVWSRTFPVDLSVHPVLSAQMSQKSTTEAKASNASSSSSSSSSSNVPLGLFDSSGQVSDMALLLDLCADPIVRASFSAFAVVSLEFFVDAISLVRPFEEAARLWPVAEEQKDQCVLVCHSKLEFPHTADTCHTVSAAVLTNYPVRTACGRPVCIGHRMVHCVACKDCAVQSGLPFAHHFVSSSS
jgi:hypothetical protein